MGQSWRSLTRHRAHPSGSLAVSTVESGKHLDASTETRERATAEDGCFDGMFKGLHGPIPFLFMHRDNIFTLAHARQCFPLRT
jgi:hypothetical protein